MHYAQYSAGITTLVVWENFMLVPIGSVSKNVQFVKTELYQSFIRTKGMIIHMCRNP